MPWTPKQKHFFQAVEHGWEPPASMHSTLSASKAKELLKHGKGKAKTAGEQLKALKG
jgi:hypothetical protein